MAKHFVQLWRDDRGFIVSAELVLVATITVLAMVVGLSEVASGVNQELEDVGSAFGSANQSFSFRGQKKHKGGRFHGSKFNDTADACDDDCDLVSTSPRSEDHY